MSRQAKIPVQDDVETARGQLMGAKRFAREHGLTLAQAQALLLVVGDDPDRLTAAAERLKNARAA